MASASVPSDEVCMLVEFMNGRAERSLHVLQLASLRCSKREFWLESNKPAVLFSCLCMGVGCVNQSMKNQSKMDSSDRDVVTFVVDSAVDQSETVDCCGLWMSYDLSWLKTCLCAD